MGHYSRGDVVLAPVNFGRNGSGKIRPAVIVSAGSDGLLSICPVTSREPSDKPHVLLTLYDFADGGLDLFKESYVLTSTVYTIQNGHVVGKKGRLTNESIDAVISSIPLGAALPGHGR